MCFLYNLDIDTYMRDRNRSAKSNEQDSGHTYKEDKVARRELRFGHSVRAQHDAQHGAPAQDHVLTQVEHAVACGRHQLLVMVRLHNPPVSLGLCPNAHVRLVCMNMCEKGRQGVCFAQFLGHTRETLFLLERAHRTSGLQEQSKEAMTRAARLDRQGKGTGGAGRGVGSAPHNPRRQSTSPSQSSAWRPPRPRARPCPAIVFGSCSTRAQPMGECTQKLAQHEAANSADLNGCILPPLSAILASGHQTNNTLPPLPKGY